MVKHLLPLCSGVRKKTQPPYFRIKIKIAMFGLFKKKSEEEKLRAQYTKLLEEAHRLSTSNRKLSDQKMFEAEEVMKQLEKLG